jgi:hypothetical protein
MKIKENFICNADVISIAEQIREAKRKSILHHFNQSLETIPEEENLYSASELTYEKPIIDQFETPSPERNKMKCFCFIL